MAVTRDNRRAISAPMARSLKVRELSDGEGGLTFTAVPPLRFLVGRNTTASGIITTLPIDRSKAKARTEVCPERSCL
jgi:hypothetical protein